MTFKRTTTMSKLSLAVAGGLTLLALTGCATNSPVVTEIPSSSSESTAESTEVALGGDYSDHIGVAEAFEAPSDWSVMKTSDRTKPDGTEIHNIRWDSGDKLVSIEEIKTLFEDHGYTLNKCYEQINNCTGTTTIESGTVNLSMSANAWTDSKTGEHALNDVSFDVSMD